MRIGGVVLAGGAGSRFGGRKLLAELWGEPVIVHAVRAQRAVGALERVVVVLGADAPAVGRVLEDSGAQTTTCPDWDRGPTACLQTGVAALGDLDAAVVTLGDQPLLTPAAVTRAVEVAGGVALAARATYAGQPGHPVVIKRTLFGEVRRLRSERGARTLLAAVRARRFEVGDLARADDVDTPDDLERLRALPAPAGAAAGVHEPR